jgi:hypothetical protein
MCGTARAAQRGARPREQLFSGIGERVHCGAQVQGLQTFSGIGERAHCEAQVQGALAHQDVRL